MGFVDVALAAKKKDKGQDLFKEYCKPCHGEDAEAGEYTPMTLIQDQWERFFDEKYVKSHEDVLDPDHDNQPVTEAISEEDLEILKEWAIDHAADSEHPMTCG
jgi:hypothetical protein